MTKSVMLISRHPSCFLLDAAKYCSHSPTVDVTMHTKASLFFGPEAVNKCNILGDVQVAVHKIQY